MIDEDLKLSLLDGPFEQPLWSGFLERLRLRTGACYASLVFREPAPARPSLVHLYAGEAAPPLLSRLYRERMHLADPLPYHSLEEERVYALAELLDPADPRHAAFYREMLVPSRMSAMRLMRIAEPAGLNVWLSVAHRSGDFAEEAGGLIAALAPYLRAALRTYAAIERERFAATLVGDAIRRLNYGWIALDAAGCVLAADAQATRLLGEGGALRRDPRGVLTAAPPERARELAGAIAAMVADPGRRPRAIVLCRDPWLDMLLVRAGPRAPAPGPPPALIAYVHGDDWRSSDRCGQLAELFELLPSEARLALALSRGMTIAEAAAELGLTIETARTYSKRIYAKIGARGQPDLVRFVHRSVLAIA